MTVEVPLVNVADAPDVSQFPPTVQISFPRVSVAVDETLTLPPMESLCAEPWAVSVKDAEPDRENAPESANVGFPVRGIL
jgi:hypothetical protein